MSISEALTIGQDTLYMTMLLAMPSLVVSLAVGLIISILQTVTNIQDQTLSFVPRILGVGLILVMTMAWTLQTAVHFFVRVLTHALEVLR